MIIIIFENCVFEMWTAIRIQIQMRNSSCDCVSKLQQIVMFMFVVYGQMRFEADSNTFCQQPEGGRGRGKLGRIGQAYSPFLSKLSFKRASKCWLSAFNLNVNAWRLNWANKFSARHPHPPSAAVSLCPLSLSLSLVFFLISFNSEIKCFIIIYTLFRPIMRA